MAVSIEVRKAGREDAAGISACLVSAFEPFRSRYTPRAFEDTVPGPGAVLERMKHMTVYVVSLPNQGIVGTIASSMDGEEGHLRGMAVLPAWQGLSVAEYLLRAAEVDLVAAGCARLTLDTTIPLQRAIRFYERNRFVASGRVRDFFGMPLYEYVKLLSRRS